VGGYVGKAGLTWYTGAGKVNDDRGWAVRTRGAYDGLQGVKLLLLPGTWFARERMSGHVYSNKVGELVCPGVHKTAHAFFS
jgi:hypothetical protein